MVTPPDFEWCRLVTIADTQKNWHGTEYHSHTINGLDYWCRLLKWAGTKNQFLVLAAYVVRYHK
jgi:hypothetical protein